ncbi:hypothetical protein OPIT5_06150 [Opitutaceae bacterium TAV5]|nr:hypothetical protein OPIT5_06150 [Opitutaceae bacterium TAV5]
MTNENPFGEIIYSYSRAQAIKDGVLVDLSQIEVTRQHWWLPLVCTSTVWAIIEEALKTPGQDVNGILHDISTMAKLAIRTNRKTDQVLFKVIITGQTHTFKLHIGPGDAGEPVLTLMLPNED